jgi:hypothetical protein
MTSALSRAGRIGLSSLSQLLLGALLRVVAMLTSIVAIVLRMGRSRRASACHAKPAPASLPETTRDTNTRRISAAESGPDLLPRTGEADFRNRTLGEERRGTVHRVPPAVAFVPLLIATADQLARAAPPPFGGGKTRLAAPSACVRNRSLRALGKHQLVC